MFVVPIRWSRMICMAAHRHRQRAGWLGVSVLVALMLTTPGAAAGVVNLKATSTLTPSHPARCRCRCAAMQIILDHRIGTTNMAGTGLDRRITERHLRSPGYEEQS